jgi:MarR family transcriptional regulator, organic hydroperoxide resistance regulator
MEIVTMYCNRVTIPGHPPTPGFLVWRLSMKWRAAVDRAVEPFGLTHAQYSLLASLLGMAEAGIRPSQRELADHTGLEPLYVSKLARALEQAGLVERAENPSDTRAVVLTLTRRGRRVAEQAIATVLELQEELTAPLGGRRGRQTRALVDALETLLAVPTPGTGDEP